MKADIDHLLRTALNTGPHPDPQINAHLHAIALNPAARAQAAKLALQRFANDPLLSDELRAYAREAIATLVRKQAP
jgi:hypothetical protein